MKFKKIKVRILKVIYKELKFSDSSINISVRQKSLPSASFVWKNKETCHSFYFQLTWDRISMSGTETYLTEIR